VRRISGNNNTSDTSAFSVCLFDLRTYPILPGSHASHNARRNFEFPMLWITRCLFLYVNVRALISHGHLIAEFLEEASSGFRGLI